MSETKFKEARGNLAFSQQLMDKLRQSHQPQMAPEQPQMAPQQPPEQSTMTQEAPITQEPTETPKEEQVESKSIIEGVKEVIKPMFDKLMETFSAKEEEPKDVEIKIEGEMKPKEDGTE